MKHFIFTRWNLLLKDKSIYNISEVYPKFKMAPEEWNKERALLFEKYCLYSVNRQTNKNFTWLLSFSPQTPPEVYEKYLVYPFVKVIFTDHLTYINDISNNELVDGEWVITTRLDNDDCLAPTFIEKIQNYSTGITQLIDTLGCQYNALTDKWYAMRRNVPNSPFISVVDRVNLASKPIVRTCFDREHTYMHKTFPNITWIQEILFCRIIHDNNLASSDMREEITINNTFFNDKL